MRGRLCVGRAAAVAAVAVPLAGGLEGSPGGVRRGSRGTTMVKKRKGRVVIDSDTEDSGSDENLDQVRAGRGGAGRRSGRAESGPREPGTGRAQGLPARAPGPPRALTAAAASFLSSSQLLGPSGSGWGLETEPEDLAPWAGRRGRDQAGGPWVRGTEGIRDLPGPDWGDGLQARLSGPREIGSITRQPGRLVGFGGGVGGERGALGGGEKMRALEDQVFQTRNVDGEERHS